MQKELQKIRKKIDKIDKTLQKQLEKREELVVKIKKIKEKSSLPIHDETREEEILSPIKNPFVRNVFKEILKSSKDIQSRF